ncbi:MAG TPA: polysaccharide biosynthesis/export family protein [Steroidobacteraceae bacterium]
MADFRAVRRLSTFVSVLAVAFLLVSGATVCRAADAPEDATVPHMTVLGVGDSVVIQIFGEPEQTPVYVGDDGTINAPYVGRIPVAGISPVQAATRLSKALKAGGFFVDPHVTVLVTQGRSQFVSVVGEVGQPGRYPITPRTTIVELLAQAGGLKLTASDTGFVMRSDDATGQVQRYPVNLNVITNPTADSQPWAWAGGDSLIVPPAEQFSIEGQVATPGRYRVEAGMTVLQAITRAGGVTERGSEGRVRLRRADKPGHYTTIHAKPGDLVKANDIIIVKESLF